MRKISYLTFFFCFFLHAQVTVDRWEEIIANTRKSTLSVFDKEEVAQKALTYFRKSFEQEMGTVEGSDLYQKVLKNPEVLNTLTVNNGKFQDLFTEFSLLIKQIAVEKKLNNCDSFQKLKSSLLNGAATYSPCAEGSFAHSYITWKTMKSGGLEQKNYSVPNFAYTKNVSDLLQIATFLEIKEKMPEDKPLIPSGVELLKLNANLTPKDLAEIYNKLQLRKDAYQRAQVNAIRNSISLEFQHGGKILTPENLKLLINQKIAMNCLYCNEAMKKSMNSKLNSIINNDIKSGKISFAPKYQVVSELCQRLKIAKYPFYESYSIKDISPISYMMGKGKVKRNIYQDQRIKAITAVAQQGGNGLLLLTEALTNLDEKVPERSKLKCNGGKDDENLIALAAKEAQRNAEEYLFKLNSNLNLSALSNSQLDKNLSWILHTNPRSFGEALLDTPETAEIACKIIADLKTKDEQEKMKDQIIIWGSTIVGGALTATGVLAPAGATLTMGGIAFGVVETAAAVGTGLSLANGTYNVFAAKDAYQNSELFEDATFASADYNSMVFSQSEYLRFQKNKINAMVNFGVSGTWIVAKIAGKLKNGKNLAQINQEMEEAINVKNINLLEDAKGINSISEVESNFSKMNEHLMKADFLESGKFTPTGKMIVLDEFAPELKKLDSYAKNRFGEKIVEGIESSKAIRLEPHSLTNNTSKNIESIVLKKLDGTYIGKVACVKIQTECLKGLNGQIMYDIPVDQNYIVILKQSNGEEIVINTSLVKSAKDLPQDYRISLDAKKIRDKGLSGAHTSESFNQYLAAYPDRIKVVASKTKEYTFTIPGTKEAFKFKRIITTIDGVEVKSPKTIFENNTEIQNIEKALAPKLLAKINDDGYFVETVKTNTGESFNITIPCRGGEPITIYMEHAK